MKTCGNCRRYDPRAGNCEVYPLNDVNENDPSCGKHAGNEKIGAEYKYTKPRSHEEEQEPPAYRFHKREPRKPWEI